MEKAAADAGGKTPLNEMPNRECSMALLQELEKECLNLKQWLDLLRGRGLQTESIQKELIQTIRDRCQHLARIYEASDPESRCPSGLDAIRALRPEGPRRLAWEWNTEDLKNKIRGALLGRAAGCILGVPCEGMTRDAIRHACLAAGLDYPLRDYWCIDPKLWDPEYSHCGITPRRFFLKDRLDRIGADDDLAYTLLGLIVLEKHGSRFTTEDLGRIWLDRIPIACTAEEVALNHLRQGIPAAESALKDNPYHDLIGADIRSDAWAYASPGWPERAAEFAHRDAWLSHRGTGIHGALYFAAVIAAAFSVEDPIEAAEIGLTEIPADCLMSCTVRQTLAWCRQDNDWSATVERILKHFEGMSPYHTLNNAALTLAGLYYGQRDFEKTITLTVMGGLDTDCSSATAGSILGAILGADRLPEKWICPLGSRIETYLTGLRDFTIDDAVERFVRVALQLQTEASICIALREQGN